MASNYEKHKNNLIKKIQSSGICEACDFPEPQDCKGCLKELKETKKELEQLVLSEGKRIKREEIVKQLKIMANAWDTAHLSINSKWNEALAQCGKSIEAYIKKLEAE